MTYSVSVLQDKLYLELKVHHKNHGQYQSGYYSVCILRYLSYKVPFTVIPQSISIFQEIIKDVSHSVNKEQLL